jgi:spermidine/putrescine transport system permease protein
LENWKSSRNVFWTLFTPGTFWLFVFFLLPLLFLLVLSVSTKAIINGEISINDYCYFCGLANLENYQRAFGGAQIFILWKTIWISAIATALCLLIAYPIAFGICFAPARWKPLLLLLVILPFWINLLIRTYSLIAVLRTQGYLNKVLDAAGLLWLFHGGQPFEMLYNNGAVIVGLVYVYMPFMVLPLYATIERLDRSYLEASLDLGASQFTTLMRVTVPLTMPGIVTGIILVFIPCLGTFLTSDMLGGANAIMIGNVIEQQFKTANDWPFGSAISFLLMFATLAALGIRHLLQRRSQGVDV